MTGEQLSAGLETAARRLTEWFGAIPVKKIQGVACAVVILWLGYGVAQLAGVFVPASSTVPGKLAASHRAAAQEPQATVDIKALQAMNLFGAPGAASKQAAPAVEVDETAINAEKTRLNLELEGIVYSSNPSESVAVIVYQGEQKPFYVGDKIPGGNRVTLAQVLLDRVILDNNGKYEALYLYDGSKSDNSDSASPPRSQVVNRRVADMRSNPVITRLARNYRERIFHQPSTLAEAIRIVPAKQDGQMIGYRISPGRDRKQFAAMGLQPNDIVTSINDIALNEPSNALQVYKLMRTAKEANFTINRNGETMEIRVSLGNQ